MSNFSAKKIKYDTFAPRLSKAHRTSQPPNPRLSMAPRVPRTFRGSILSRFSRAFSFPKASRATKIPGLSGCPDLPVLPALPELQRLTRLPRLPELPGLLQGLPALLKILGISRLPYWSFKSFQYLKGLQSFHGTQSSSFQGIKGSQKL